MADNGREFSGKSVDDAIDGGLRTLNLRRDQVEVEIISRGSRGIFGIGSEPARVRITTQPSPTSEEASSTVQADDMQADDTQRMSERDPRAKNAPG